MRRILAATGVAFLVGVLLAPAALAGEIKLKFGPELTRQACGGGTLVINVEQDVLNDADQGFGGYWALDRYERHIKVWQQGSDTFCATVRYEGKFTTFAGTSPSGNGTVDAGVTGEMTGGYRTTHFTANWLTSPSKPTRGDIGTFDYQCDVLGNCPARVSWLGFYFTGVVGFGFDWWGWIYHAGHNGTWVNAIDPPAGPGSLGDITGSPHPDDNDD